MEDSAAICAENKSLVQRDYGASSYQLLKIASFEHQVARPNLLNFDTCATEIAEVYSRWESVAYIYDYMAFIVRRERRKVQSTLQMALA